MNKVKFLLILASLSSLAAACNKTASQPNPVPSKSVLTAEQVTQRYLDGFKYADYKAAYSYTCQDFKAQIQEDRYINSWKAAIGDIETKQQIYYKDFQLKEVITENGETKARVVTIANSPLTNKDTEMPGQLILKQENYEWCVYPDIKQFN